VAVEVKTAGTIQPGPRFITIRSTRTIASRPRPSARAIKPPPLPELRPLIL
jgi:hypothetical protein